ncbi:C39 family peptidase [Butyrivibrio sp. WCD3002]|uniref:C39 family peptidase n=1 Tax=Butyrivibrio sp. WCD3002 TaxID=1280676 RepID=UPI000414CCCD|nr:C39 family peptidase [Butyrivibrio sp. WCD3002]
MNIKKIIRAIILFIIGVILAVAFIFGGQELFYRIKAPSEYVITTENEIRKQYRYECGAYSTAYVLRSLGEDVDSKELYDSLEPKGKDGSVPYETMQAGAERYGYKLESGMISLAALKYEVSKGVPVIVGMEIAPGNSLPHFLPIVGYDDEYIYAAESVGIYANEKGDHYNRKIKTDTFKELWKTDGHNHNVAIRVVRKR